MSMLIPHVHWKRALHGRPRRPGGPVRSAIGTALIFWCSRTVWLKRPLAVCPHQGKRTCKAAQFDNSNWKPMITRQAGTSVTAYVSSGEL